MAKQPWLSVTEIYLRLRRLTILAICDFGDLRFRRFAISAICDLRFAISAICDFEILEKFWRKFWEVRQEPHIPYYYYPNARAMVKKIADGIEDRYTELIQQAERCIQPAVNFLSEKV